MLLLLFTCPSIAAALLTLLQSLQLLLLQLLQL
jgi:hypothetical protein